MHQIGYRLRRFFSVWLGSWDRCLMCDRKALDVWPYCSEECHVAARTDFAW